MPQFLNYFELQQESNAISAKMQKGVDADRLKWSETGLYCDQTRQSCAGCPVGHTMSLYPLNGQQQCFQPEANAQLKLKGIPKTVIIGYHKPKDSYIGLAP